MAVNNLPVVSVCALHLHFEAGVHCVILDCPSWEIKKYGDIFGLGSHCKFKGGCVQGLVTKDSLGLFDLQSLTSQ